MLFFYAKKFGITLEGFQSLLEVVRNHCPKPNKCASPAYKSKRLFSQKFRNVESHEKRGYCTVCCNYIEKDGSCVKEGCAGKDRTPVEFYCKDVTPQLKQRMEGTCSTGLHSLIYLHLEVSLDTMPYPYFCKRKILWYYLNSLPITSTQFCHLF